MNHFLSSGRQFFFQWLTALALFALLAPVGASAQGAYSASQANRSSKQQRQNNRQNPYASVYTYQTHQHERSFGTFFAEYNRMTMSIEDSYANAPCYNGVSVGFDYFLPFAGGLGVDLGLKGQYLFRNEKEGVYTYKDNLLSAVVPVRLAYHWRAAESFSLLPFAGVFGRMNLSGKKIYEESGKSGRTSISLFDDKQTQAYGLETMKRFQVGWEAGVTARISDTFTIGGSYWMDISKIGTGTKLKGFNLQLGACF